MYTAAAVALGGAGHAGHATGRVGTLRGWKKTRENGKESVEAGEAGKWPQPGHVYTAELYTPLNLWRMENEWITSFASKVFDFFKPLPLAPPTPPDALDLAVCYGGLVALACTSVYCGSIGSLPFHQPRKDRDEKGGYEDSDSEDDVLEEKITTGDAWLFPVMGSCMLFGLYLLLKYVGPEWVNKILRYWFAIMSWGAVFRVTSALDI